MVGEAGESDVLVTHVRAVLPENPALRDAFGVWTTLLHQGVIAGLSLCILFVNDLSVLAVLCGALFALYGYLLNGGKCPLRSVEREFSPVDLGALLASILIPGYEDGRDRGILTNGKVLVGIYFALLKIAGVVIWAVWRSRWLSRVVDRSLYCAFVAVAC